MYIRSAQACVGQGRANGHCFFLLWLWQGKNLFMRERVSVGRQRVFRKVVATLVDIISDLQILMDI